MLRKDSIIMKELNFTDISRRLKEIRLSKGLTQEYVSNIANDYSLDLNTLAQWIDDRENYTTVMNTFGQMAEILGKRSANILEDTYYIYDYSFRQDGRLKDMTLMGGSENIGYSFRFSYADDTEVSE